LGEKGVGRMHKIMRGRRVTPALGGLLVVLAASLGACGGGAGGPAETAEETSVPGGPVPEGSLTQETTQAPTEDTR